MMNILVIDDEAELRLSIAEAIRSAGHTVVEAGDDPRVVRSLVDRGDYDLAVCDVRMPGLDGLELFRRSRATAPLCDFILMTAYADVGQAVAALKEGAADYLRKPFDSDELLHQIARVETSRSMRVELAVARQMLAHSPAATEMVGESPQMRDVLRRIERMARSEAAVLIQGESGTGKELVAKLLHERSARSSKPFVAINCGAFPDTLIESELFGFERGAFTGAVKRRDGRFKAADGGTLFLDEVAELPLPSQAKLLRVLQEGSFEPIGTNASVKVNVRLVSATHRNLRQRVADGSFREDLYYRINALDLVVPPLREREGDIPVLLRHFLSGNRSDASEAGKGPTISEDAFAALLRYHYPGNVRELAHAVEHAVVLAGSGEITLDHLPAAIAEAAASADPLPPPESPDAGRVPVQTTKLADAVRVFERAHLQKVLAAAGGKRVRAAEMLGISRKSLWEKLREWQSDGDVGEKKNAGGVG